MPSSVPPSGSAEHSLPPAEDLPSPPPPPAATPKPRDTSHTARSECTMTPIASPQLPPPAVCTRLLPAPHKPPENRTTPPDTPYDCCTLSRHTLRHSSTGKSCTSPALPQTS